MHDKEAEHANSWYWVRTVAISLEQTCILEEGGAEFSTKS